MTCSAWLDTVRFIGLQLIAFTVALGCLIWTVTPREAVAQGSHEKTFTRREYNPKDPVTIIELSVDNKRLEFNENFNAGPDWLRGTRILLKNVSNKDVIYIELQFYLPETRATGNEMLYRSELGNKPSLPVYNAPLLLRPDEKVSFNFSEQEYRSLQKFVGYRHKISELNKVELKIGFVVFADLTAWGTGLRFKQDPSNPRRWIPFPPDN